MGPYYFQSSTNIPPDPYRMTATLTQPLPVPTPSHTELLGGYLELQGDLTALCARFSLSGVQLLALLEDPSFRPRLKEIDEFLVRTTILRLQTTAAEALTSAFKTATTPAERCRAGTNLARLSFHWGQLPSPPRTPRARPPASDATPTPTAAPAPTPVQTPSQTLSPIPPLNLSDLLAGVTTNPLDQPQSPPAPLPLPINVPSKPSKSTALINLAGLVPQSRASSA